MGGSSSTSSISDTSSLVSSVLVQSSTSCVTGSSQTNTLNLFGNGNKISDIYQKATLSFNSSCQGGTAASDSVVNGLSNTLNNSQNSETQALVGFLDSSKQKVNEKINNSITDTLQTSSAVSCLMGLNGANNINIGGNDNNASNIHQDSSIDALSNCINSSSTTNNGTSDITNYSAANQQYKSDSILEPFTAAFEYMTKDITLSIIGFVVLCILIACVYFFVASRSPARSPAQPPQPAPTPK